MTNARFEDLEKRARKVRFKKYVKFSLILAILIAVFSYFLMSITPKETPKLPLDVKKIERPKKTQNFTPIKQTKKVEKKVIAIKKETNYDTIKLKLNVVVPSKQQVMPQVKETKKTPQRSIEKYEPPKKVKINLQVKEVKSEGALLKKFQNDGSFESAQGLASFYFKKKRFEKSIFWSKKASKLDAKEALPWLVYAKSKYALGKKEEAIKSLELYLDYFSSDEIRQLLDSYRSGK